jgi:putative ABC transport system ATP-binding protein
MSTSEALIDARGIHRWYGEGEARVEVLRGLDLRVDHGEYAAIVGASGSGKSTLLSILGCLDRPRQGTYHLAGHDVFSLRDDKLSELRLREIGFVFQSFQLIPQLTILENVEVPLFYANVRRGDRHDKARSALERVGLGHRLTHKPTELSGGEQQRCAIARALVHDPPLLLADEPTGNLDSETGRSIMKLIDDLHDEGRTVLLITHDPNVANHAPRCIRIKDGMIEADERKEAAA